ncbi:NAD(P)/FAD-dependent oxidoreductase [Oceanobacter kriegii]|uniref:NAD(P)/FAD-dependent oxidoreductase n=1 Tax=Oceanobacter kriegii TaxID=64972 RepID=UPI0004239941|nr:FAD-binding oxidoreductase [Oceanobacter kriegii]
MNAEHSLYRATANELPDFPELNDSLDVDVTIIGGGLTGISAALELAEQGYSVVLLEAEQPGWGASGRSGGQIIVGAGENGAALQRQLGPQLAKQVFDTSVVGIQWMRQRIQQHQIQCDFQAGQMEAAIRPSHMAHLQHSAEQLDRFGYPVQLLDAADTASKTGSTAFAGSLFDPNGGHLHPLNYTLGLTQAAQHAGAQIFGHSRVTAIQYGSRVVVKTATAEVRSRWLVIAANAYLDQLVPELGKQAIPVGSYICSTEPVPESVLPANCAVFDTRNLFNYFRKDAAGRMIWGGRVGLTNKPPVNLKTKLHRRMAAVYPQLKETPFTREWGGFVSVTRHRTPSIGKLTVNGKPQGNVLYAHGYSGHGMVMAAVGGVTLAQAIRGQAEQLDVLSKIPCAPLPNNGVLHNVGLAAAMLYFSVRDALG